MCRELASRMISALLIVAALVVIAVGAWRTRHALPFREEARDRGFDKAPLSVERNTGAIHVKDSMLVLRSGMKRSEFLTSDLYAHTQSARYFPLQNGLGHSFAVSFRDAVFENVHLRLSFENDRLGCVDFGWGPHVPVPGWTHERVQADVARYRAFLIEELGSIDSFPFEFEWGTVYAARDEKAGTPAAGIRYRGFDFRAESLHQGAPVGA